MTDYLIPDEFIEGNLYVKIDHVEQMIDFLDSCQHSGLTTNQARTLSWSQQHLENECPVYVSNMEDIWENNARIVIASWLREEPLNSVDVEELTISNHANLDAILDLL